MKTDTVTSILKNATVNIRDVQSMLETLQAVHSDDLNQQTAELLATELLDFSKWCSDEEKYRTEIDN